MRKVQAGISALGSPAAAPKPSGPAGEDSELHYQGLGPGISMTLSGGRPRAGAGGWTPRLLVLVL